MATASHGSTSSTGTGTGRGNDTTTMVNPATDKSLSASERKRHREKQRRNKLNHGLDELATLLFSIDPSLKTFSEAPSATATAGGDGSDWPGTAALAKESGQTITNRVELINCTLKVMKQLHKENEDRKQILGALAKAGFNIPHVESSFVQNTKMDRGSLPHGLLAAQDLMGVGGMAPGTVRVDPSGRPIVGASGQLRHQQATQQAHVQQHLQALRQQLQPRVPSGIDLATMLASQQQLHNQNQKHQSSGGMAMSSDGQASMGNAATGDTFSVCISYFHMVHSPGSSCPSVFHLSYHERDDMRLP